MLHKETFLIKAATFKLIQKLQAHSALEGFNLVGGTALALQLGHRNSIDIDLFTNQEYDTNSLLTILRKDFNVEVIFTAPNTLLTFVDKVKTDFITHNYPLVNPPITEEGITYLSLQDIAAMKLNAISNSGMRLKDFIDVYFLLEHFSLHQMIEFYTIKYPNFNPLIPLRAVGYFDDIDPEIDPPKLRHPLPLKKIKDRITSSILNSRKVFKP